MLPCLPPPREGTPTALYAYPHPGAIPRRQPAVQPSPTHQASSSRGGQCRAWHAPLRHAPDSIGTPHRCLPLLAFVAAEQECTPVSWGPRSTKRHRATKSPTTRALPHHLPPRGKRRAFGQRQRMRRPTPVRLCSSSNMCSTAFAHALYELLHQSGTLPTGAPSMQPLTPAPPPEAQQLLLRCLSTGRPTVPSETSSRRPTARVATAVHCLHAPACPSSRAAPASGYCRARPALGLVQARAAPCRCSALIPVQRCGCFLEQLLHGAGRARVVGRS